MLFLFASLVFVFLSQGGMLNSVRRTEYWHALKWDQKKQHDIVVKINDILFKDTI